MCCAPRLRPCKPRLCQHFDAAMASALSHATTKAVDEAFDEVKEWTEEEHQRYLDSLGDIENLPLFRDVSSAEAEEFANTLRVADTKDDEDAIEQATQKKDRGNAAFRKGHEFYGNALRHYRDALVLLRREDVTDAAADRMNQLASVLHSNIAAVLMKRNVWHRALGAAQEALTLDPTNQKALFRQTKCCVELGQFARAIPSATQLSESSDPDTAKSGATLLAQANAGLATQTKHREEQLRIKAMRLEQLNAAKDACRLRGIKVGPPLMPDMRRTSSALPTVDEDGVMLWPVTILYPEKSISEFVESCSEAATIQDLLSHVLPAPWDTDNTFTVPAMHVYYRTNQVPVVPLEHAFEPDLDVAATPHGVKSTWVRVPHHLPLAMVLMQPDYVVPDIPVLYALRAGSPADEAITEEGVTCLSDSSSSST
jgi:tetratricopeptide (TPR) repeat protein